MKKNIVLSLLLTLLLVAHNSLAKAPSWELDKAHTNIYFGVDHIFMEVRGHFDDFSAAINFDPEDLAGSNFFFEIEVALPASAVFVKGVTRVQLCVALHRCTCNS